MKRGLGDEADLGLCWDKVVHTTALQLILHGLVLLAEERRLELGWTKKRMGQFLGASVDRPVKGYWHAYLNKIKLPGPETIVKLAVLTGFDLNKLKGAWERR